MPSESLPIFIAAAILLGDILAAGIVFFALNRKEHSLAFVIPPIILFTGILAAGIVYYVLSGQPE